MVGGYVILTKKPLVIGENDIGAMYGSIQNANNRIDILRRIQKPVLIECNMHLGGGIIKMAEWFEVLNVTSTTITLSSNFFKLTYNRSTGIATLTVEE